MRLLLLTFIYLSLNIPVRAQTDVRSILEDKEIIAQIKQGLQHTYNFAFREAEKCYSQVQKKYPNHPAYSTLMALNISWEYGHALPGSEPYEELINHLKQSIQQSEVILNKQPKSLDGIFFALQCHSMMAYRYSLSHNFLDAASEAKKTYSYMKEGMKRKETFNEFYFSSGIYNYFREQYPETHAIIRPLIFFFEPGNKNTGLADLDKAGKEAIFTKAEALNFLSRIYVKYENQADKAAVYTQQLHEAYPNNLYFTASYIETSMLNKQFSEVEILLESLLSSSDPQYIAMAHVFYGYYYEKGKGNYAVAKANYAKGQNELNSLKKNLNDLKSYTCLGLARVYLQENNIKKASFYYKEAAKYAEYKSHRDEIEDYQKSH